MTEQLDKLSINLLDRLYSVKCKAADSANLQKAAAHLAAKLDEIRSLNRNLSREEIAMMAALNISYDLLNGSQANHAQEKAQQSVAQLNKKIKEFLTQ
jgi:cell division protein ZapA